METREEKGKKRQVKEDINRRGRRDGVEGRDNLGYPRTRRVRLKWKINSCREGGSGMKVQSGCFWWGKGTVTPANNEISHR